MTHQILLFAAGYTNWGFVILLLVLAILFFTGTSYAGKNAWHENEIGRAHV